jgi:2,4-dienoyl-CoA reductase (NADPH2)
MRNYRVSREGKINLEIKTKHPMKILIIGAGPGGLEAARIAKILGHTVTILEKRSNLGGQANLSWVPPGRHDIYEIMNYYSAQIEHLGIELHLGVEANLDVINKFQPDVVIFATGVKYNIPDIPGIDGSLGSEVYLAEKILEGEIPIGKKVVVVGGSATGIETAIWAAEQGALNSEVAKFIAFYDLLPKEELFKRWLRGNREVIIIDMLPKLGMSIGRTTRGFLIGQLMKLGIESILDVQIKKFEGKTLKYEQANEEKELENIDTFILATGVVPNDDLFNKVKETNPPYKIFKVGDCKKPRTMMEAIHEGFRTAYNLDK